MWMAATLLRFPGIIITQRRHHHSSSSSSSSFSLRIHCCDSKASNPRGFGPSDDKNVKKSNSSKEQKGTLLQQQSKSTSKQPTSTPGQAPGVSSRPDNKYTLTSSEFAFEQRLQAVKRSALEKKKSEEKIEYGAVDYDAPVEPKKNTVGLGTKIGVGVAVVVFGLVFALGDFLPTGSIPSKVDDGAVAKLSKEETAALQSRLQQYEATLSTSPKDPVALEGAAVTLAELGEYTRAATLLEDLVKEKPSDPDAFRVLGEVKYELKDYEASAAAYKSSAKVSKTMDFEVLRGLTNTLVAANKPDEAVQILLESRERLNMEKEPQNVDPIQVDLLLGKAYADWGHISDAVSVYDQLISSHPNDFRSYLAKGILLKQNGNIGDAERMFIQARFFAPEKAKTLVDRYSRS